jgi:hypothetical protein
VALHCWALLSPLLRLGPIAALPVWMQGKGLLLVLMYVLSGLVLGSLPQHL